MDMTQSDYDRLSRNVSITCPTCKKRNFSSYPDFTAHIGNPTCANEAVADDPRDRPELCGLARLDVSAVVEICEILADVIDDGIEFETIKDERRAWQFYPQGNIDWRADDPFSDADRLDFIAEVRKRIWQRAAPATTPAAQRAGEK